jgi:hypothetical protein
VILRRNIIFISADGFECFLNDLLWIWLLFFKQVVDDEVTLKFISAYVCYFEKHGY